MHFELTTGTTGAEEVKCLVPDDDEVPRMEVGYGQEGAQVQRADVGTIILPDREIMKKTLLRGDALIFVGKVCDAISSSKMEGAKRKRTSLAKAHWEAVVAAAMEQYRVGTFVHGSQSPLAQRRGQSYNGYA